MPRLWPGIDGRIPKKPLRAKIRANLHPKCNTFGTLLGSQEEQ
jgi:hypothetical protein